MATRQYVGARYVTKIYENSLDSSSAEWEASVNYEPLTLVTYNNGSYLSKKEVPGSVGDPASNPLYWVQTGFYNGQIAALDARITRLEDFSFIFFPTGDSTDRSSELISALTTNKSILFAEGEYYFNSTITLPDNAKLMGVGSATKLIYTGNSNFLVAGDATEISSLVLDGGETYIPGSIGAANGVYVSGKTNPIRISNVTIQGFNNNGILVENMGWTYLNSVEIVNCYFKWNSCGIKFDQYGEYGLISNCSFYQNNVGANPAGGNNTFTGCHFCKNTFGIRMLCDDVNNSAHGSIVNCTFNHNAYGFQINDTPYGENIVGCIFYGSTTHDVELINCTAGINFNANNFGADSIWGIARSNVAIKNNTFSNAPTITSSDSVVTGYGNTLGDGSTIVGDINTKCDPFNVVNLSKTYTNNAVVTEANFNSGISAAVKAGVLYLRVNLNLTGNPGTNFVEIGNLTNIPGTLAYEPIVHTTDYSGHKYILYIHYNGKIDVYGDNPTGSICTVIPIPLNHI